MPILQKRESIERLPHPEFPRGRFFVEGAVFFGSGNMSVLHSLLRNPELKAQRPIRGWVWVAAFAIGFALLLLLLPHPHSGDAGDGLAILPIFFVGMISPLSLLPALICGYAGHIPEAPLLPAAFQRPPPLLLA